MGYFEDDDDYFPDMYEGEEPIDPEFGDLNGDDIPFSPTSWDKLPGESNEEYEERIQDQNDLMEYYDE